VSGTCIAADNLP